MPLLRSARRVAFGIHIGVRNAGLRAGMVRSSLPDITIEQLDAAEFFNGNATPVSWRTGGSETAPAFSSVLITEHP
jgi:hypothetical protein